MNHRADYLLQVLEKIGSPLMSSVIAGEADSANRAAKLHNEAQKIAELLAKTVQASIEMSNALDLGPMGEITDSVRIALTGLASPLVAGFYNAGGKAPGDAEIKRMVAALQAVLTFAENFEANTENADRLRLMEADGTKTDNAQESVQYIAAFLPVINAVAAFSFGQPEQKMVMEIASRLNVAAKTAQQRLFGDLGGDARRIELGILTAMAHLYAACHQSETARIQSLDEHQRTQMQGGDISFESVWKGFEVRAAMLEQLARGITSNGRVKSGGTGPKPMTVPPASAPAVEPVQASQKPAVFSAPPAAAPPQTASQQPSAQNPMAFFKGPPKEGSGHA